MFVLGHLGIGGALARRVLGDRDRRGMLLGLFLPDLIDKPLYYGLSLWTGRHGAELGLISGTRTFGHSLLLLLVLLLALRGRGLALAAGMATHLFLDLPSDLIPRDLARALLPHPPPAAGPPTAAAVFWPLLGWGFPQAPFRGVLEHAGFISSVPTLLGELLGGLLLLLRYVQSRSGSGKSN